MFVINSDHTSQFDVRDLLSILRKRKWLIILPAILVTAVATVGSYWITPIYQCSTLVQLDTRMPLINEVRGLVGQGSGYRRQSMDERRERLVSIYNEITSLRYIGLLENELQLSTAMNVENQAQTVIKLQPRMTLEQAKLYVLQSMLKDNIEVKLASVDQVEMVVRSTNPDLARDIANTLGKTYISEKVQRELSQIRLSQDFSDIQLERYDRQLTQKIGKKTELEQEILSLQLDESVAAESNRADISREIDRIGNEVEEYRDNERLVLGRLAKVRGINTSQLSLKSSDNTRRINRELESQIRQIGPLMTKAVWNDPQMLNFTLKLNNLQLSLENENKLLVNEQFASLETPTREMLVELFNIRSNLDFLYSKKPYLQSAMDEMTSKIVLIPEYQTRLAQIDHEISAMTDLRDRFKRQQESSTISQALVKDLSASRYRIVEPAKLPLGPQSPKKQRIVLMGLVLGLGLGLAGTILVELMDNSFRRVEEVEEALNLPVLGILPKADFLKKVAQ